MAASIQSIEVSELHFDPRNPRLPPRVDGTNDEAVLNWMLMDAGLVELMGSIAENGFFPAEPLLVTPNRAGPGLIVLEGNRRLAAVKLLLSPRDAPRRRNAVSGAAERVKNRDSLLELPVVVFDDRQEVLDYLGFRHVTGVKQWEPAAKARYLQSLYDEHLQDSGTEVYRVIARIIGSRADYVKRLLAALRLSEKMAADPDLAELGVTDEGISFSLITLALNYTEIAKYLKLTDLDQESLSTMDEARVQRLGQYLFVKNPDLGRTQLGESRNMRLLASALAHSEGRKRLRAGDIVEEAVQYTLDLDHVLAVSLEQAKDRLSRARTLVPRARNPKGLLAALDEIEAIVAQLFQSARRRQRENMSGDV